MVAAFTSLILPFLQEKGECGRKSSLKGKMQHGLSPALIATAVIMTGLLALSRYARHCYDQP